MYAQRLPLTDMNVIIRRTMILAGMAGFILGAFSLGLYIAKELLTDFFGFRWEIAMTVGIFLTLVGYEPVRGLVIKTANKYFFQKKYNYQKFLKDASRGLAQIESLHHLLGLVSHFITMRMRLKNAAILICDSVTNRFHIKYLRGYPNGFNRSFALLLESPLIQCLSQEREALDIVRVRRCFESREKRFPHSDAKTEYDFKEISRVMNEMSADCCVPSFLGGELRSVLVLGGKKSGDAYTQEDLNVLFTVAQESAIAIENARLFDEVRNRSKELEKINSELELARARLTHALEETERANKELQNTQAQLIHEQKMATLGRLAASVGHEVNNPLTILSMNVSRVLLKYRKDSNLRVEEILELFQKMEQNVGRIKAVVNTLTGLLKKSEKGKFEPLSLKLILEETLPLVQFQTYLDNPSDTEVEFNIPSNLPLIRGDLERLQEVFLNMFINAYHAMSGRRNRKIAVTARLLETDPKMVEVAFSDNGGGMTDEIQKKIFTYGFTTKGPGKGSGMGLYMCKYIIELHGGEIRVKSQPNMGTTFFLTLPPFNEPIHVGIPGRVIEPAR